MAVRIWDVPPSALCRQHLLGEHRELHGLWNVLMHDLQGYRNHPETKRWVGRLPALEMRHQALVDEMARRGYNHQSPLVGNPTGQQKQDQYVDDMATQWKLLASKPCPCPLESGK
jgi:hypothetical protein